MSNIYLNVQEKSQIILVRSFENKEKAMKYYNGVEKNKKEYVTKAKTDFNIFVSTQKNYREVIKQRSANNYRVFFDKHYLGKN